LAGYYDELEGENRKILELKPGLTSLRRNIITRETAGPTTRPFIGCDQVIFPDKSATESTLFFTITVSGGRYKKLS
jgi:hypothetical protein